MKKIVAIILAGGIGKRMHNDIYKQYLPIAGKPMVYYSLKTFDESRVDSIVLVVTPGEIEYCQKEIIDKYGIKKVNHIVEGGKQRYDSVYEGLKACERDDNDIVIIHDCARPMVTDELIEESINAAIAYDACVIAVPVKDTIKVADEKMYCDNTLDRDRLWNIQTPQAFSYKLCKKAYDMMMLGDIDKEKITDDAMVVTSMMGIKSKLCMGNYSNIKVTTSEDLIIAKSFLDKRDSFI